MVRMTSHPPTRSYVARRRSEGLSTREIIRCLKRYIVREIYQTITATSTLAPRGPELRTRRHELALPLRVVADALGTHISTLSRLERSKIRDPELATRIHAWLHHQQPARIAA
jgi:transposase